MAPRISICSRPNKRAERSIVQQCHPRRTNTISQGPGWQGQSQKKAKPMDSRPLQGNVFQKSYLVQKPPQLIRPDPPAIHEIEEAIWFPNFLSLLNNFMNLAEGNPGQRSRMAKKMLRRLLKAYVRMQPKCCNFADHHIYMAERKAWEILCMSARFRAVFLC